jgi:hypothetical protein
MPSTASEKISQILREGWVGTHDLESLLRAQDGRLKLRHVNDVTQLAVAFGLTWKPVYYKPVRREDAIQFSMLSAADVAYLLFGLGCCGFSTDASPLVKALVPLIKAKTIIDRSELYVLWYATRPESKTLVTTVPEAPADAIPTEASAKPPLRETRVLPSGHTVRVFGEPAGPLQQLQFLVPGHRRPRGGA